MKMARKFAGKDYKVCNLEGLYWGSGEQESLECIDPKELNWLLVIRVPEFIQEKDLQQAVAQLRAKGKAGDFEKVALQTLDEGSCVQMLHVGPYNQENKTIDLMLAFIKQEGLACRGKHHEIYLSDPGACRQIAFAQFCGSPWSDRRGPRPGPMAGLKSVNKVEGRGGPQDERNV